MSYRPSNEAHAFIYLSSSGVTALTAGAAPVKLTFTTNTGSLHDFTHPTDNRFLYTPARPSILLGVCSLSFTFSGANSDVSFYIAVNDHPISAFSATRFIATGGDKGSVSINGQFDVNLNDYFELWGASDKNGNLTMLNFQMSTIEIHPHTG